ncbi:DegT/DnrJ/EryC1/StrS family aminotransferase [Trinickia symbiotica]|uniref:DegT/DnrJ/EryC1/StrS family aminotransferase n=1 Tax=Trinickia symbiotica TaxID=863227 RepID=A0A2N7X7F3_9BURK|nr:DegT/DnrJ/EryC1/StrS family aminotransferase [Trinickia symbiotica]PMS37511.1 DegT/DnrJ/EryC1/StrS family aminotransferase [Trinickia symbiotica]
MSTVPFFSPRLANAGVDLHEPVRRVLASYWYVLGSEVLAFEREYAEYLKVRHCVSVANGTDAIELALRAVGVAAGDRVAVTANAGFYGSTAVLKIGAAPVYVDVDASTLTMSCDQLQRALHTYSPKAIVVTHLYGQLADIEKIIKVATDAGVPVIEDCAQAHGAKRGDRFAGSYGALGCFSFYPTKNLGALGDGGAIVTDNEEWAGRLRQLRQYGWSTKYHVAINGGCNSRLDELQAAVLRAKLPQLDAWNDERRDIARRYNAAFAHLPVRCPSSLGSDYVAHLYVIRTERRDELRQFLAQRGIAAEVHYPVADHLQTVHDGGAEANALPVTETACSTVLSLPCFPGLAREETERVVGAVLGYFDEAGHS